MLSTLNSIKYDLWKNVNLSHWRSSFKNIAKKVNTDADAQHLKDKHSPLHKVNTRKSIRKMVCKSIRKNSRIQCKNMHLFHTKSPFLYLPLLYLYLTLPFTIPCLCSFFLFSQHCLYSFSFFLYFFLSFSVSLNFSPLFLPLLSVN
jgi:hypothetical protein